MEMKTYHKNDNKRIAKNTLMLYFRMILMMLISLYTSRVVLHTLGIRDFGTYNIVGGLVVLFTFINQSMVGTSQRFLNFELGKNDEKEAARVFSMSINCQVIIICLLMILGETIGLWFLNAYIKIPYDRLAAANWVYQLSLLTTCANVFYAPYNGAIIAHERMSVYAYVSVFEAVVKLGMVYVLLLVDSDKLIFYGFLMLLSTLLVCGIYICYCLRNFGICKYHFVKDADLFKRIIGFSGWSLFGSAANLGISQGLNIIQNLFFGVAVNAAMGVAQQVNGALNRFVGNFVTAYNPQIVKSYASGDRVYFMRLISMTSKLSYFLLFIIGLPVVICCNDILHIWLKEVPEHASSFCQIMIMYSLVEALTSPLWIAVQAYGKIKRYQLTISFIKMSTIPISVLCLYLGGRPEYVLVTYLLIDSIMHVYRLAFLRTAIQLDVMSYVRSVIFPCLAISILSIPVPLLMHTYLNGIVWLSVIIVVSVVICGTSIYRLGLNAHERDVVRAVIGSKCGRMFGGKGQKCFS